MEVASLLLGDVLLDVVDTGLRRRAWSEGANWLRGTLLGVYIIGHHSASGDETPKSLGLVRVFELGERFAMIGRGSTREVLRDQKTRAVFESLMRSGENGERQRSKAIRAAAILLR